MQLALLAADEKLIRDRELDRREAASEVRRRGLINSGLALTLLCAVFERWIAKRVEVQASIYLETLNILGIEIDYELETQILEKLRIIGQVRHAPQFPQITVAMKDGLDEHCKRQMQLAADRAFLQAKARISFARLQTTYPKMAGNDNMSSAITYQVSGPNAKINVNSIDNSQNHVDTDVDRALNQLVLLSKEYGTPDMQTAAIELREAISKPPLLSEKLAKWLALASSSAQLMHQAMPFLSHIYKHLQQ